MDMRLTFLGTGSSQGVPVVACGCDTCRSADPRDARLRTSALVEVGDVRLVIDVGPDFRQQMLRAQVRSLDGILLTHEHRDHIAGLDDVRAFNWVQRRPVDVWALPRTAEAVRRDFSYAFAPAGIKYPGAPEVQLHEVPDYAPFDVAGVAVQPLRVMHGTMPIMGFRIGALAYITDISHIHPSEIERLRGIDVLVLSAVRLVPHPAHLSLQQAIDLFAQIAPRRGYITHIGHQLPPHAEVQRLLPNGVYLAYDGLYVDF